MATASIIDNIVISDPKQVEAFADAVEEAAKHPQEKKKTGIRLVRDPEEVAYWMKKWR